MHHMQSPMEIPPTGIMKLLPLGSVFFLFVCFVLFCFFDAGSRTQTTFLLGQLVLN